MASNSNLPQRVSISGSYRSTKPSVIHTFGSGCTMRRSNCNVYVSVYTVDWCIKLTLLDRWMTLHGFVLGLFCRIQSVNKAQMHTESKLYVKSTLSDDVYMLLLLFCSSHCSSSVKRNITAFTINIYSSCNIMGYIHFKMNIWQLKTFVWSITVGYR